MDPFTLASRLLGETPLTSGQLAQLRALNTRYFTERYARRHAGADAPGSDSPPGELEAMARDIRDLLTDEQRKVFDENWAKLGFR